MLFFIDLDSVPMTLILELDLGMIKILKGKLITIPVQRCNLNKHTDK